MATVYLRLEPGSTAQPGGAPQRLAELERLLASAPPPERVDDWRLDAQRLLQPAGSAPLWAGPVAWCDAAAAVPPQAATRWVFLAQPLHAEATLSSVRLPPNGLLTLSAAEARDLVRDFAALPAAGETGQPRLAAAGGRLFFCFDAPLDAQGHDPASLLGFDLRDFRPTGPQARRLAALCSEVEMWLFGHDVNQARRERGEPAITMLWPWGGGGALAQLPAPAFAVQGEDVLFGAWARRAPPAAGTQGSLLICPPCIEPTVLRGLLASQLAALRAPMRRGAGALHISAGRRRFTLRRMPRRWFARRAGPWWEYFDESD